MNKDFLTEEYLRGKMEKFEKGNKTGNVFQLAKLMFKIEGQISDGFWENRNDVHFPKTLEDLAELLDELFLWNVEYGNDNLEWYYREFGYTREYIRLNFWNAEDFGEARNLIS